MAGVASLRRWAVAASLLPTPSEHLGHGCGSAEVCGSAPLLQGQDPSPETSRLDGDEGTGLQQIPILTQSALFAGLLLADLEFEKATGLLARRCQYAGS